MNFVHPEINYLFDTDDHVINSVVIENQSFFVSFVTDIIAQINSYPGKSVISENNEILAFNKNAEILDRFVPFDLNKKSLINKIITYLEKSAAGEDFFERDMSVEGECQRFLYELSYNMDCALDFPKLSIASIIKAAAPELKDDYDNLGEKLLDYMELVRRFDRNKLFFTINLRSYLNDGQMELFAKSVISHGLDIIMIDNREYSRLSCEQRLIIDNDLCEIT